METDRINRTGLDFTGQRTVIIILREITRNAALILYYEPFQLTQRNCDNYENGTRQARYTPT